MMVVFSIIVLIPLFVLTTLFAFKSVTQDFMDVATEYKSKWGEKRNELGYIITLSSQVTTSIASLAVILFSLLSPNVVPLGVMALLFGGMLLVLMVILMGLSVEGVL